MKTRLVVDDAVVLKNGKVTVAVTSSSGKPVAIGMVGHTASGDVEVEVVSVGLVNSPPAASNKQGLQLQLRKGTLDALKGATLDFE